MTVRQVSGCGSRAVAPSYSSAEPASPSSPARSQQTATAGAPPLCVVSPMASASGAMAKHEQILVLDPPTDLKFKGRRKAAPDRRRAVGVEGRSEAGARVSVPSPTPQHFHSLAAPRSSPLLACPATRPIPSFGRSRLGARASPGEAELPGPGADAAILRFRGGASRCCPRLALVLGPRGPSRVVWEGVGGR